MVASPAPQAPALCRESVIDAEPYPAWSIRGREAGEQLFRKLPAVHGLGPALEIDVQVLADVRHELAAVELHGDGRVAPAQDMRDRRAEGGETDKAD